MRPLFPVGGFCKLKPAPVVFKLGVALRVGLLNRLLPALEPSAPKVVDLFFELPSNDRLRVKPVGLFITKDVDPKVVGLDKPVPMVPVMVRENVISRE